MSQLIGLRGLLPELLSQLSGSPLHFIFSSSSPTTASFSLRVYPGLHRTVINVPYSTRLVKKSVGLRTLRLPSSHPVSLGSSEHSKKKTVSFVLESILEDNFRGPHTYLFTDWLTIRHGIGRPNYTRNVLAP